MSQIKTKKHARRKRQQPPWWLIFLVAGSLLLVFGAIYAFNQSSQPKATIEVAGAPALKVDQEQVDLGDVKLGQWVEVSFQISNVGDRPLRFSKAPNIEVKEGC